MINSTARRHLVRLLRAEILVGHAQASTIVDRSFPFFGGPIHDAVLTVSNFHADGSGMFDLHIDGCGVGGGTLCAGALDRWLATPTGQARMAEKTAERAAEEARIDRATVASIAVSETWSGTAELTLEDGRVLPMIPVPGENGHNIVSLYQDLRPGTTVRVMIVPAIEIPDDFARTLPDDQPCVDWVAPYRMAA